MSKDIDKSTALRAEIDANLVAYREAADAIVAIKDAKELHGIALQGVLAGELSHTPVEVDDLMNMVEDTYGSDAKVWERKAKRAKDKLVTLNRGLIKAVAKSVLGASSRNPDNLLEAEQEGAMGVMRAVDAYDPARGIWSVCARHWIRYFVQTCQHRQTDFPRQRYQKMPPEVVRQANGIRTKHGREPVWTEISHKGLPVTQEQWEDWNTRTYVGSFDATSSGGEEHGEGGLGHADLIADPSTSPELAVADAALRERIEEAMRKMSPRNADITRAIYIDGDDIEEVMARFRIQESRVFEIKKMLADRLRRMLVS